MAGATILHRYQLQIGSFRIILSARSWQAVEQAVDDFHAYLAREHAALEAV